MKGLVFKLLRIALFVGVAMLVMRLVGPKLGKRMERMLEEAPDDFPPKWMYVNITAIRDNTERILEAVAPEATEADTAAA